MNAGDVERLLKQWETTGEISSSEVEELERAIHHGDPQARTIRRLLPLLRRDARATDSMRTTASIMQVITSQQADTSEQETVDASEEHSDEQERVGHELELGHGTDKPAGERWYSRHGLRTAALAASLVLAVGVASLVGYTLGYQQGSGEAQTTVVEADEQAETVTVHFRVVMPEAGQVSLVGDFNDWDPDATPLQLREDGKTWSATLDLRGDRAYTYNFVIDNDIVIPDPAADRTIPDSFGGEKSVISL